MTIMLDDPLVLYPGAAALLLVAVSLLTGWARLDFLPLVRPGVLVRVCLAVLTAFAVTLLGELGLAADASVTLRATVTGVALVPLYLVALAYGPSVGLVAALLFAPLGADRAGPAWPELLFAAELLVLGWLAIYPSPRRHRWAGPLNVLLARALIVMSAGVAVLSLAGADVNVAALLNPELTSLPGTVLALLVLFAFGPASYQRLFPHSRVAPRVPASEDGSSGVAALGENLAPLKARPVRQRSLEPLHFDANDPNA